MKANGVSMSLFLILALLAGGIVIVAVAAAVYFILRDREK
jgi:hypothetical protein